MRGARASRSAVEEPWVHHRLTKALQMQLLDRAKFVEQAGEGFERHKSRWATRRAIVAELDSAHLAAQVALPDRLKLQKCWQRWHGLLLGLQKQHSVANRATQSPENCDRRNQRRRRKHLGDMH